MPPCRAIAVALAVAACLTAPATSAHAAKGATRDVTPWATVNVCDTAGYPDGIGIRGSMPGTGDRADELFLRVQVQYLRRSDNSWRALGRGADSGFVDLGHGGAKVRQAGRTFTLSPPGAGRPAFVLRGLVTFEWRRDGAVTRRVRKLTAGGHPDAVGADPEGFSAATCSIR